MKTFDSIITLDPSYNMGWCFFDKKKLILKYDELELSRSEDEENNHGRAMHEMYVWLTKQIKTLKPQLIIYEATSPGKLDTSATTCLFGLYSIIEMVCFESKVRSLKILPRTLKKKLTNNSKASKEEMIQAVNKVMKQYGVKTDNDNIADALAILITHSNFFSSN